MGWVYHLTRPGRDTPASEPSRILVIRLDLLGDVLFTMTGVKALRARYPDAHIAMVTLPYTAPLARSYREVDEVIAVDTNRIRRVRGLLDLRTWREYGRTISLLRSRNFDLALSVAGRTASLCAFLSGSTRSIGYDREAYPFTLTERLEGGRYEERMHEVEYVLRLAQAVGAEASPDHLQVTVAPEAQTRVRDRLRAEGIGPGERLVVIHAGSLNGSAKRWPPSRWASFSRQLRARAGVKVVLAGAPSDAAIAAQVMAEDADILSMVGQTSIEELVALLADAALVATGDSGPLHLAVALGIPLLAAYGPTDPAIHGPYHPVAPVAVHRQDLACSPCYSMAATAECPLGDPICMRLVGVQPMVASAVDLLNHSLPGKPAAENWRVPLAAYPGANTSF